jgi:hypothetical protein
VAFLDLASEIAGVLPGCSPTLCRTWVNRAWRKIRDAKRWSFLVADAAIVCPAALSAGTASIVQFTNTVVLNAAASAALLPFTLAASVPQATQLQIRFTGLSAPSPSEIYNIVAVNTTVPAALVLTLDRVVMEVTAAASSYIIYRCYIIPPATDFLSWVSVTDMVNGYAITGQKLTYTSAYIDARDPQRLALGLAYFLGLYRGNANQTTLPMSATTPQVTATYGQPIYELWPGSTQGQTFYCRYRRRGTDFINTTDVQPPGIPDELIIQMALLHFAYPHVQANIGKFPTMARSNWALLAQELRASLYGTRDGKRGALMDAKLADDEQALQSIISRGHGLKGNPLGQPGFPYPVDASYFQSHAIFW